jgi:hypothetical protein
VTKANSKIADEMSALMEKMINCRQFVSIMLQFYLNTRQGKREGAEPCQKLE